MAWIKIKVNQQGPLRTSHPLPTTPWSSRPPKRVASHDPIVDEDEENESYHPKLSEKEEAQWQEIVDQEEVELFDNTHFTSAANEAW